MPGVIDAVELGLAYRRVLLASATQLAFCLLPPTTEGMTHVETAEAIGRLAFVGWLVSMGFGIYYGLRAVKALGSRREWVWVSAMLLPCSTLPAAFALTVATRRAYRSSGTPVGALGPRA